MAPVGMAGHWDRLLQPPGRAPPCLQPCWVWPGLALGASPFPPHTPRPLCATSPRVLPSLPVTLPRARAVPVLWPTNVCGTSGQKDATTALEAGIGCHVYCADETLGPFWATELAKATSELRKGQGCAHLVLAFSWVHGTWW